MVSSKKVKKPDNIIFNCDFCENIWNVKKEEFTMRELKFDNGKIWTQFSTICPKCRRTVSIVKIKGGE